jgi:hypothetical protein
MKFRMWSRGRTIVIPNGVPRSMCEGGRIPPVVAEMREAASAGYFYFKIGR